MNIAPMGEIKMDILGLAEIFLHKEAEICVTGYEWYSPNRESCRRTSVGIEILIDKRIKSWKLGGSREGLMWVKWEVDRGKEKSGSRCCV